MREGHGRECDAVPRRPRSAWGAIVLLASAFCFRLWVGLAIGLSHDDAQQVYLIGLKYYLTGAWPYFGADVDWGRGYQIPGALQGLVVGLPLHLAPVPEAPFVALNVLSFASLCLFSWYATRCLPRVPAVLVWAWILTVPWTIDLSTYVYNPSYVLTGAILFFVGALETYPATRRGLVSPPLANFMMGFALFWVVQFHLSFVILLPYTAAALVVPFRAGRRGRAEALVAFAAGAAASGAFLLPTCFRFGWTAAAFPIATMIDPGPGSFPVRWEHAFDILARFLSFASLEASGFVGRDLESRVRFLSQFRWLSPILWLAGSVGLLQPLTMVWMALFAEKPSVPEWRTIRLFSVITVALLYASFALCKKVPRAHTFYVTFPVAMLFGLYCWNEWLQRRAGQIAATIVIALAIVFQVAFALDRSMHHPWALDREAIARAIRSGNYEQYAARRFGVRY